MPYVSLSRRHALAGIGGLAASSLARLPASAQSKTFNIVAHDAHRLAATTGKGGDITTDWQKANAAAVNWITLDVEGVNDRVLREASLSSTTMDLGYIFYMTDRVLSLMEPLDSYLQSDPIDGDLSDFPPSLITNLKSGGTLRGLPIRISANGLLYNEQILQERGITTMPKTFEDMIEMWRKCTYTKPDGSKVNGLIFLCSGGAQLADGLTNISRSYGGDYILGDASLVANQDANIQSLEMLQQLYKDGVLARETFTAPAPQVLDFMAQGRAATLLYPVSFVQNLNNPNTSSYAGRFKAIDDWPMISSLVGKMKFSPGVQSWSVVIPKNLAPDRKKLSWSFVKNLVSRENTVRQTLNGNGPARISALSDPRISSISYMAYFAEALKYGRVHVPGLPNAVRINDTFVQAAQAAILGRVPIKKAMDDAVASAKALI